MNVPPYMHRVCGIIFLRILSHFLQKISEDIVEKRILMEYYVAAVRMQRKMSIRALAEKSGVAKSHIQKIEAGKASPSLEVMCRLAEALDCDLSELYSYK